MEPALTLWQRERKCYDAVMDMTMPMNVPYPLKLRIEDFELLERAGAFSGLRKAELIDGAVLAMNAEYRLHSVVKNEIMFRLRLALNAMESPYTALVEATLALPPYNLPEPDVIVAAARPERDYFRLPHIALVVEVSDTSLRGDLGAKRAMYAANGVPEYWIVDLDNRMLHQFWEPIEGSYRGERSTPLDGLLRSQTMHALEIDGTGMF